MVLAETVIEGGQIPLLSVSFPQESGIQSFKTCLEPSPETLANWELYVCAYGTKYSRLKLVLVYRT
jgi:hypothetical protein